jgi:hypothetical protein
MSLPQTPSFQHHKYNNLIKYKPKGNFGVLLKITQTDVSFLKSNSRYLSFFSSINLAIKDKL